MSCKCNFNLIEIHTQNFEDVANVMCVCEVQGGFLFGGYLVKRRKKGILLTWAKDATASVWPVRIRGLGLSSTVLKCGTFQ